MKKTIVATLSVLASASLFASQPNVHTWHNVTATAGQWNTTIQVISESEHAWFIGPDGKKSQPTQPVEFKLDTSAPQKFGFDFDVGPGGADFNVAYTVTLVEQSASQFAAKTCVFVVTAKAPAKPDIATLSYNGANCTWKDTGIGEDYTVG